MANATERMVGQYAEDLAGRLSQAQVEADHGDAFQRGRKLGLYEALSMLINRAKTFNVSLSDLGIENIDADKFI